jgi:hypothetical protein
MIRFVFRFIGLWILAAGFVALVRDGTKSIAGNTIFVTRLADDWNNIHPSSLQGLEKAVSTHVSPYLGQWVWDPAAIGILNAPSFAVLGIIGAILILIGRKKKPLIGYARD